MQAIIMNYRRGRHTAHTSQMILGPEVKKRDDAKKLIGKKVIFKTTGNKLITGTVTALHGNGCALKARFTRGLPGTAVGQKVEIVA